MKNFKTIPNYPNYAINKNGDVFNKRLKVIMKSRFDKYGYKRINLSKHNEKKDNIYPPTCGEDLLAK